MITKLGELPENILGFEATGEVTAEDYESVLIPEVERVLEKYKKVRLLYHLGPEFKGFTVGAMWDDAKVGLKHLLAWEKIALVTDIPWLRNTIQCISFMIPGTIKLFGEDNLDAAMDWIVY